MKILITGAAGTIGRQLIKHFIAADIPVRILVRKTEKFQHLGNNIDVYQGHLGDRDALQNAMHGIDKLFLLSGVHPNLVELQCTAIDIAQQTGITHTVKLSGMGATEQSPAQLLKFHGIIEKQLENSGMFYTHLRPNAFMQNFLHAISQDNEVVASLGDAKTSFIDTRDIAASAFAILTSNDTQHHNRAYTLTGAEALSYTEAAACLSAAMGQKIRYHDLPVAQTRERMIANGMPAWWADYMLELFAATKRGAYAAITDCVASITGKQPILFREFADKYFKHQ